MKIKRIIAEEWLFFLICLFIGIASYTLDDYLHWKLRREIQYKNRQEKLDRKKYDRWLELSTKGRPITLKEYLELDNLEWTYGEIKKRPYKPFKGQSEDYHFFVLPYFLCLFIRSIVWSIKQLRGKL